MDCSISSRASWAGSVADFLKLDKMTLIDALVEGHKQCMNANPAESQIEAWHNCYAVLKKTFSQTVVNCPKTEKWSVIFEYQLPRERGRRPDVVLLTNKRVIVLEFKDFSKAHESHIDQVGAYSRDLENYHAKTRGMKVIPILVPTLSKMNTEISKEVIIAPPSYLEKVLLEIAFNDDGYPELASWLESEYAPLPSLVEAARVIFNHEPLPDIRRAQSAGIPATIDYLIRTATKALEGTDLHLALVTGVPGSGKTLVGLQFVYLDAFGGTGWRNAVFLSGNGPLVDVLQYALKNKIFVQDVHGFLKEYGGRSSRLPEERIWVYDEAQRAWDAIRVLEKRGEGVSEPLDFLRIGVRMNTGNMLVGLIGEGQEIHLGEEGGLKQWNDAIAQIISKKCIVHCPKRISGFFTAASNVETEDSLDLSQTLRTHMAEDVQKWGTALLEARINDAWKFSKRMSEQGFDIYVTRDLEIAKIYVRERYEGEDSKRYGLLASSKDKTLPRYGVLNDYYSMQRMKIGPWYIDPVTSERSCCSLRDVATEFQCQGLELDMPIVCWAMI